MAHIKAWHIVSVCDRPGTPPRGGVCDHIIDGIGNGDGLCDSYVSEAERIMRQTGKRVLSDRCDYYKVERRFIERDYKHVEAEPHDGTWDCCFGYYDLMAGRACYLCEYLEIDGRVVCDERDDE